MNYIARTLDGKTFVSEEESQLLKAHLTAVSKLTGQFTNKFTSSEIGELIGLLHDIGKYQEDFQNKIRTSSNKIIDHSTAGAKILTEEIKEMGTLYGLPIACHHTGLMNFGTNASMSNTYYSRLENYEDKIIETIKNNYAKDCIFPQFNIPKFNKKCDSPETMGYTLSFYLRMLLSALVDADRINSEEFSSKIKRKQPKIDIEKMLKIFEEKLPKPNDLEINKIRNQVLNECINCGKQEQGLFTLTAPTGVGKTLSSLAFALNHINEHNLERIIYVIPYTSIIEQNANVFKNIFSSLGNIVLEHHSNIVNENLTPEEEIQIKWATENWDVPIVVTTNVQFFNSIFSSNASDNRKIHNLANSVIIFDEVQMLPLEYIAPCMTAISELILNYKSTAVLCSATQPCIDKYKYTSIKTTEIITNPVDLFNRMKRVEYKNIGKINSDKIIELSQKEKQCLIIVNSRKHAYYLYNKFKEKRNNVFHLSTLMYSKHRNETLSNIKNKLKNNEEVIVISTQLIEAGVDVDFPVVFREIAGLDNIIQSGGRANRNGKLKNGIVYIFESIDDFAKIPKSIRPFADIFNEIYLEEKENSFELYGIEKYFNKLHKYIGKENLDSQNILNEFKLGRTIPILNYKDVSDKFSYIQNNTYSIIVENEDNKVLIQLMENGKINKEILRQLTQYSVNIYKYELDKLIENNVIIKTKTGLLILCNPNYYNAETGLEIFTDENKNAESFIL